MRKKQTIITKLATFLMIGVVASNIIVPSISKAAQYVQEVKSGIDAFPESYRVLLNKLHDLHPEWTFDAYYTGISWDTVVKNEINCGHNRIAKSANSLWKCSCGNIESGFACASDSIIKYYLDPRNFISNDVKVFQFLESSYNETMQNVSVIESIIKNTFMGGKNVTFNKDGKNITMSYAQIIMDAGRESKTNPYTIATKIIQEVGTDGSASVSGIYPGYEGYYNFFNYGANDEGNAILNGMKYAKNKGWNNQYKAIVEGAKLISNSYINKGQNTPYFYKWDVVGDKLIKAGESQTTTSSNLFWRQYMTNVQDPTSQASTLYNTYVKNNLISQKINFIIPVYNDMPSSNKLPTNLTSSDGDLYYMVGTDVRVRTQPNTSSSTLATMKSLDEIVAVLERECSTDTTGRKWDKVKISSGIIGYIASEYLRPCGGYEIPNKKIEVKDNNIIAIPNTTGKEIAQELNLSNYEIKKNEVVINSNEIVGTQYKLKDNNTNKEYIIIVLGDVNSDAKVKATDYMRIKNYIMDTTTLTDSEKKAADVNRDNEVKATDYMRIKNYIMGTSSIKL